MSDVDMDARRGISDREALLREQEREQHRPKHHKAADFEQIKIAQTLFEWWWRVSNDGRYSPRWEKCDPDIQAFWMDGAWRVMAVSGSTLTGRLHQ